MYPIFVSCLIFKRENYGKKTDHAHGGLVLSTGMALAQTTVTGKVISQEDGEPVIGASVRIVGTKTGTATDVDGNSSVSSNNPQNLFGQGWGSWSNEENGSWGPRLDGREHRYGSTGLSTGETLTKPFSYVKNNIRDFYQVGKEWNGITTYLSAMVMRK